MQRQHHLPAGIGARQYHYQHHKSEHGSHKSAGAYAVQRSGHYNGHQCQRNGETAEADKGCHNLQYYDQCGQHGKRCDTAGTCFHLSKPPAVAPRHGGCNANFQTVYMTVEGLSIAVA